MPRLNADVCNIWQQSKTLLVFYPSRMVLFYTKAVRNLEKKALAVKIINLHHGYTFKFKANEYI